MPSSGATELMLIRHGESQAYLDGTTFPLVDGHGDPPLSATGREQAQRLCERLSGAGIGAIYVTTLCRTAQTAAPLAERLGLEPLVEADLREVYLGEWEGGRYRKMVAERHPIVQQMFADQRWDVIPGAESEERLTARVGGAVRRLADRHPGERIAVFTHGGVIGHLCALASGSRPFAFTGADNASISRFVVAGVDWVVRSFNETAHLDDPA